MQRQISNYAKAIPFYLSLAGVPAPGLTPVVALAYSGTFVSGAGSVSEVGGGWYTYTGADPDFTVIGDMGFNVTAAGADDVNFVVTITANDPFATDADPTLGQIGEAVAATAHRAVHGTYFGYYVDPINGSDGSPTGSAYAPFETIDHANGQAGANDAIIAMAGSHSVSTTIPCVTKGAGKFATIITNTAGITVSGALVRDAALVSSTDGSPTLTLTASTSVCDCLITGPYGVLATGSYFEMQGSDVYASSTGGANTYGVNDQSTVASNYRNNRVSVVSDGTATLAYGLFTNSSPNCTIDDLVVSVAGANTYNSGVVGGLANLVRRTTIRTSGAGAQDLQTDATMFVTDTAYDAAKTTGTITPIEDPNGGLTQQQVADSLLLTPSTSGATGSAQALLARLTADVDGITIESLAELVKAIDSGQSSVTNNNDGTQTVVFFKADGTTPKLTIIYTLATGARTSVVIG